MPTSLSSLLIVVIAIVPGTLGNAVFTRVLGTDWREREIAAVARILAFSVFGLALYAWVAAALGLALPIHILPVSYTTNFAPATVAVLAPGYIGHTLAGGLAGGLAAIGTRLLAKLSRRSAHQAAWDEFVTERVNNRWIVVTLTNGESFCGILETVDASVDPAQRDLLLAEPAQYDADRGDYIGTGFRHLFLKATQIESIASLRNQAIDTQLLTRVGQPLFTEEPDEQDSRSFERGGSEAGGAKLNAAEEHEVRSEAGPAGK